MQVSGGVRRIAGYGEWASPLSARAITRAGISLAEPQIDGDSFYWLEGRPQEGGRVVVVRQRGADGEPADMVGAEYNVRTRVHEYGGAAYAVVEGVVYFVNFDDQRIYVVEDGQIRPLTPAGPYRYADIAGDGKRLICVREDHSGDGEPVNTIVAIDLADGGSGEILTAGEDFYASPRVSADGTQLAWVSWRHPNMPWDTTALWLAEPDADGSLTNVRRVAGGLDESIVQPEWTEDGSLIFLSDRSGWWNLYRLDGDQAEPLYPLEAEFGQPAWVFGTRTYAAVDSDELLCIYGQKNVHRLAQLEIEGGRLADIETPYQVMLSPVVANGQALLIGGRPDAGYELINIDLASAQIRVLRRSSALALDEGFIAAPQPISFPSGDDRVAHAFYYAPTHPNYTAPQGEMPPLIVISHGGPTGAALPVMNNTLLFWTSRGFAVVDVNYGGSTGYGRAYRQLLNGRWGVVDLEDCIAAAEYLCARGLADGQRLIIRGGSAGGYTTLCALTFSDIFAAGASYFGVSDLVALARDTHKFESRYLDNLVGPFPEARDVYIERSPIYHVDRLNTPMIVLQGGADKVVPPNQAELIVDALREKGVAVEYVLFEEEGHGFRSADNIVHAIESELAFYGRTLGFTPAQTDD